MRFSSGKVRIASRSSFGVIFFPAFSKTVSAVSRLKYSSNVITRLALHDKVYKVKEEAFRAAQAMGITYRGNPIRLGRKDIGFKTKDFTKVFLRIKREKSMEELDLQLFKEAFKTIAAEMYDVMEFEKGQKFDDWITNTYKCLPKK